MSEAEKTYRDLSGVMGPVDVNRPTWAEQFAVGDQIHVETPPDGEVRQYRVVGFSSLQAHYGFPVIVPDAHLQAQYDENVDSIAVREHNIVPASEVDDV